MMIYDEKTRQSVKIIATILVIIYCILLMPVLYLGRYDYHGADDFGFSAASHVAWEDTHSFISVISAAGDTVADRWNTWQGTFTTMFLMAMEPGIFGDIHYHFVPFIMIAIMSISTMLLLYVIIVSVIGCDKSVWISVSMLYLIYALECMINPREGFFWYNGATHYMIPHGMALLLLAVLIVSLIGKNKVFLCLLASILAFLLGGCNYITALGTGVGLVLGILILLIVKKRNHLWQFFIPFVCYVPGFMINVLAPGNHVRQSLSPDHPNPVKAIFLSFFYCIDQAFEEWFTWEIILFSLALIPLLTIIVVKLRGCFCFRYPILVLFGSFCYLASLYAPTSYATGDLCAGRVSNVIFLDYLLLIIVNATYILGWIDYHTNIAEKISNLINWHFINSRFYMGFIVFMMIFFSGLAMLKEENRYTTSSAVYSLINGEAARYGLEASKRTEMISNNNSDELSLPRYTATPYLLYIEDIEPDADNWKNNSMERYYRINRIIAYSLE